MEDLPIPNLERFDTGRLNQLVSVGKAIADGAIEKWADVDDVVLSALEG